VFSTKEAEEYLIEVIKTGDNEKIKTEIENKLREALEYGFTFGRRVERFHSR